jgi:hypothetical protein
LPNNVLAKKEPVRLALDQQFGLVLSIARPDHNVGAAPRTIGKR